MVVLSLFDGMACGMIALKRIGCDVEEYHAFETDKYAVKTATHNFPIIQEHGDVFDADFTKFGEVDYLIGGSPCTYWSIAQSSDKREKSACGIGWNLFCQYLRALKEANPKYFIYENNKSMAQPIYTAICKSFGFEPIMINSSLVSAQNRQRYYWVGQRESSGKYSKANIPMPQDRGIRLSDVIPHQCFNKTIDDKARTLRATCYKDGLRNLIGNSFDRKTGVAELLKQEEPGSYKVENNAVIYKGEVFPIDLPNGFYRFRKFTVDECKAIQTIPESYSFPVSKTQAYKMLGNGWTVDVIAHIFSFLQKGGERL